MVHYAIRKSIFPFLFLFAFSLSPPPENEKESAVADSLRRLDIKAEMHDIAILDNIVFAFQAKFSGFFDRLFTF